MYVGAVAALAPTHRVMPSGAQPASQQGAGEQQADAAAIVTLPAENDAAESEHGAEATLPASASMDQQAASTLLSFHKQPTLKQQSNKSSRSGTKHISML